LIPVGFLAVWISSDALGKKATNNPLKIDPGILGMLNVIKQLQHFILCNIMCYGTPKSNIDRGISVVLFILLSIFHVQILKPCFKP
jgi:hypothetical protein